MTERKPDERLGQEPQSATEEWQAMSRRRFLTGAVAGGAAGLAVAAGTGVAVWQVADAQAQAELEATHRAAEEEIARLQGLVDLYEDLEKIGLDAILETGMMVISVPLAAVEAGAKALKSGLDWAEKALLDLGQALPTARESLLWLEEQVSALAAGIENLETSIGQALDKATDNPIAEALTDFVNRVLDNLPFGLGDKFRAVLEGLVHLVTRVDELIEGINDRILEPLRQNWFADEEGVDATLFDPLVEKVLDPLEAHLGHLADLSDKMQNDLMEPTQQALAQRAQVREKIARYKEEHNLS